MVETYWCERCSLYVEKEQIVRLDGLEGRLSVPCCPKCRSHVRREVHDGARSTSVLMIDALRWPFSPRALGAVVALGLFTFFLVQFASMALLGPLLSAASLLTYAAATVRSTARGEDDPPYGVDLDGWSEVLATLLRYQLIVALAMAAPVGFAISEGVSFRTMPVLVILISVGLLYLPAALVVAAHADGLFSAIWPASALRVAIRMGPAYLRVGVASALLGVVSLVVVALALALAVLAVSIPFLPSLVVAFLVSTLLLVNARFLGLVVREHRHDVGL